MASRGGPADQFACTRTVVERAPDAAVVANLGTASAALAHVADRDRNYYFRGAMGSATAAAFGVALAVDDPVVALDGDGSLLMSLGCLSTIGTYDPPNLTVVIWDNRAYAATGAQPTASRTTDLAGVAEHCGIDARRARTDGGFEDAYDRALAHEGASLVVCEVGVESSSKPPGFDYGCSHVKHRFREALR